MNPINRKRNWFVWLLIIMLCAGAIMPAAAQSLYNEALMLSEQVASGELPPVDERLPLLPMVLQPQEIGTYGGTLVVLESDITSASVNNLIGYEPLMRWDAQWLRPLENLAQSIEASSDATTYTLQLRQGVRWSDGEPFTADDVIFAYESVLLNPEIRRSPPLWLRSGGEPATLEKIDDYTIAFHFKAPNGLFLLRLANNAGSDLTRSPKHYLEQFHAGFNTDIEALITSEGVENWPALFAAKSELRNLDLPVLTAWHLVEVGDTLVAERNPYYWKIDANFSQLPYIDRVVFQATPSLDEYNAAIQPQDMQAVFVFDDEFTDFSVYDAENAGLQSMSLVSSNSTNLALGLNLNHPDPVLNAALGDKNFRIGLSHAIDRQRIADEIFGGNSSPFQVAPRPESPFFNEQLAYQYTEYNFDLANQILDEAGYAERDADGFRLGLNGERIHFALQTTSASATTQGILDRVAADWQAVGIDAVVDDFSDRASEYNDLIFAGTHDSYLSEAVGGIDVTMQPSFYFPFHPFASFFASGWANWNINPPLGAPVEPPDAIKRQMELYAQIQSTIDPEVQASLMSELLQIAADEFLIMGTVLDPDDHILVSANLRNIPTVMPRGFDYPAPAPSNPAQFFIKG